MTITRMGEGEMKPDLGFTKKLRSYDPDLRCVWSLRDDQWLVERRVRRSRVGYGFESRDPDVARRARDGYVHVGNVPPGCLDELVILNLWKSDMWRLGGAKAVNAELDAYWESREQKEESDRRDDARQVAIDMYDRIAWLRKGRVATPEAIQ